MTVYNSTSPSVLLHSMMPTLCFRICALFIIVLVHHGCKEKASEPISNAIGDPDTFSRGIYYWQSDSYGLFEEDFSTLEQLALNKLYVKAFEIHYDPTLGVIPASKTSLTINTYEVPHEQIPEETGKEGYEEEQVSVLYKKLEVIPCIYIKNEVFQRQNAIAHDSLARLVVTLATAQHHRINQFNKIPINEIQFDCDWTKATKDQYFQFLKSVKKIWKGKLSCTLRLYPFKYRTSMGIPPVDRVSLMCYNFYSSVKETDKNAIQDTLELENYLKDQLHYPLPVDWILPKYSQGFIFRNLNFIGAFTDLQHLEKDGLKQVGAYTYQCQIEMEADDYLLRPGDIIKIESTDSASSTTSLRLLQNHVKHSSNQTLSFFHFNHYHMNESIKNELIKLYAQHNTKSQ